MQGNGGGWRRCKASFHYNTTIICMNESISNSPQDVAVGQPGIIFFIPCKTNNAPLLVEAVQGIRRAVPEASVIVLDDDRARCPQTVREVLRNMSVEWKVLKKTVTSSGHAASILALMEQSSHHEHDVLVRTKPDNLIMNAGFLRDFSRSEAGLCGTCLRSGLLCNELYALKPAVLRAILRHLEQSSSVVKCPEGAIILKAFTTLFPEETPLLARAWTRGAGGPLWGHYNWTTFPSAESLADMDMVSMSRRYQDKVARRIRISVMRCLRQAMGSRPVSADCQPAA